VPEIASACKRTDASFSLRTVGATLRGVVVGVTSESAMVVLHGGPGEAHDLLRPHLDALASETRGVVYYDQRGSGASELDSGAPLPVMDDHVADVRAVIGTVARERSDLLAFSFGALLAISFALRYPTLVRRLVLVSPARVFAGGNPEAETRLARSLKRPEIAELTALLDRRGVSGSRRDFVLRVAPYLARPAEGLALNPVTRNEAVGRATLDSLGRFDLRPELPRLRPIPTLVLHGVEDPMPVADSEDLAERVGGRLARMESSGHVPFLEQKAEFLRLVSSFLDEPR
jgi:proline iminopeptidase